MAPDVRARGERRIKMPFLVRARRATRKSVSSFIGTGNSVCVLLSKVHDAVGKFGGGRFGEESELGTGTN